jgi:LysR family glycine cleavage system transcriptional activator
MPNLNSLRMFDAAARHLNFRLVAEELNITQGAVAQQVRRLEADLQLRLFIRNARGLALTETGRRYSAPVRRALAIIEEATNELKPENKRIKLSATPSFATKWLVRRLNAFMRAHPEIDLQVQANEGLADFRTDGIDLSIRQGRPPFANGLVAVLLAPLDLCAVCSPEFATTLIRPQRIEDFAEYQLIQDSHDLWVTLFEHAKTTAKLRIMQFNQTGLAVDAAANGQGIALAPRLLVSDEIAQGKLAELWVEPPTDDNGYYILYPETRGSKPERDAVSAWLLSEVAKSDHRSRTQPAARPDGQCD